MEHGKTPTISVGLIVSSRILRWKEGLTASTKRAPFLSGLTSFGLILAIAALVVSNTRLRLGDDVKQRVAGRAFATNHGDPREESEKHVQERTLRLGPSPRIVGGDTAETKQFPWQVCFRIRMPILSAFCFCGGSLINERWILSAAHCFAGKVPKDMTPSELYVKMLDVSAGMHFTFIFDSHRQSRSVDKVIFHDWWAGVASMSYDAALVKVDRAFDIEGSDGFLKAVKLPNRLFRYKMSGRLTVSGYGMTREEWYLWPFWNAWYLKFVVVVAFTAEQCEEEYPAFWNESMRDTDEESMFCAAVPGGGKDACQGDSGGPALRYFADEAYQLGIVSWGRGCGRRTGPGVYTLVPMVVGWIHGAMRREDSRIAATTALARQGSVHAAA